MKKVQVSLILIILALFCTYALVLNAQIRFYRGMGFVPQPRLIQPAGEVVDLTGKKELIFKWSPHEIPSIGRLYYEFKLYKGYQTLADTLLIKKNLSFGTYEIAISADEFKDGQVYSWTLRQRDLYANWSDRSYQSFKVIKK